MKKNPDFWLRPRIRATHYLPSATLSLLEPIFEEHMFFEDPQDMLDWAKEHLPIFKWDVSHSFPGHFVFWIFSCDLPSLKLEVFLLDLVRKRLLCEKETFLVSMECTPFSLEAEPSSHFLLAKFQLFISTRYHFESIKQKFLFLRKEVLLFLSCSSQIEFFFKFSSFLPQEKEVFFHKTLCALSQKWPHEFEKEFLRWTQHFLSSLEPEFEKHRSAYHQVRLFCSLYILTKTVSRQLRFFPAQVHLKVRLLPTLLQFPFSQKPIIGIAIATHLPHPYLCFEERHILLGVEKILPQVRAIKESFLFFQKPRESIRTLYLEIEKTATTPFSLQELSKLKQHLTMELKKCIETVRPSVFGMHTVEDLMRSIFLLSQEVQKASDLPHVTITLEKTTAFTLTFRVIVVRVLKKTTLPVAKHFQALSEPFEYIAERISSAGFVGKRSKEVTVFRLQISKHPFLVRSNSAFHFFKARHYVASLLTKALGPIRDYNGGIFEKQRELFTQFRQAFAETAEKDPELLEDFFHGIIPEEMQALLSLSSLCSLFRIYTKAFSIAVSENTYYLETDSQGDLFFSVLRAQSETLKERVFVELDREDFSPEILAQVVIKGHGDWVLAYIYRTPPFSDPNSLSFPKLLEQILKEWTDEMRREQTLRLKSEYLPYSLDPRLAGDAPSTPLLKMLFEGLMTFNQEGKLDFGVAKSVFISRDQRQYTFALKKCFWSNGDRILAEDFCYTWKTALTHTTPFIYLLYPLKNAQKAREGRASFQDVGIKALDEETLVVDLEYPCASFLELTALPNYVPVNPRIDQAHPNWPLQTGSSYVCNGPFHLQLSHFRKAYELKKNPRYWNEKQVQLDRIQFLEIPAAKARKMFRTKQIDWLGAPLNPWDSSFSSCTEGVIESLPSRTSCWCLLNLQQFPFQSEKMRRALSLALDRQAIIDQLQYAGTPASTPLPLVNAQRHIPVPQRKNLARSLFKEALRELHLISPAQFPSIVCIYPENDLRKTLISAILQQWTEVLGLQITLESYSFQTVLSKLSKGDYQLAIWRWKSLINDPMYTLNLFREFPNIPNFCNWKSREYQRLLYFAERETNMKERRFLLAKAESLLLHEVPVIPLFHDQEHCIRQSNLHNISHCGGNIDFRYAHKEKFSL